MFEFSSPTSQAKLNAPRTGKIVCNSAFIRTPCLIASTSRGVIPHVSQDLVHSSTSVQSAYVALEDLIEKGVANAPILSEHLSAHDGSALRHFTSLPNNHLLILGARRPLPVTSPKSNSNAGVVVCTSVGFHELQSEDYTKAVQKLRPDVVVGLADINHGETAGLRRRDKMFGRTERWMKDLANDLTTSTANHVNSNPAVFAPILPVTIEQQKWYLDLLSGDLQDAVAGLAIYEYTTALDLPDSLSKLPRLSLTGAANPIQLLNEVTMGIDMFTVPFIDQATDAGIALDFSLPPGENHKCRDRRPFGIDMWPTTYAMDLSPLVARCICYTCTKHSRAYLHHLLSAKEMLAWVLLQIHNLHVGHEFFKAIRDSIAGQKFEAQRAAFERTYETNLPEMTGAGPRVRGYQYKSEGPGEMKRNAPAFVPFRTSIEDQ